MSRASTRQDGWLWVLLVVELACVALFTISNMRLAAHPSIANLVLGLYPDLLFALPFLAALIASAVRLSRVARQDRTPQEALIGFVTLFFGGVLVVGAIANFLFGIGSLFVGAGPSSLFETLFLLAIAVPTTAVASLIPFGAGVVAMMGSLGIPVFRVAEDGTLTSASSRRRQR